MADEKSRLVYSTDKVVPRNDKPAVKSSKESSHPSQQRIYVRLDRKGRGGKSVTLIEGLQMSVKDREALLRQLKARLGTGGSIKNDLLEIQGDQRDAVFALLQEMGYKPKRSGG
ncbi:MAG: translation initiation factor [Nitrospira sp.]|nr:translation initiation factor [Nitrospira sp.]